MTQAPRHDRRSSEAQPMGTDSADSSVVAVGAEAASSDLRLEAERRMLAEAQQAGFWSRIAVYTRLSGPGWLQSALTLGGGSLGSSLYLGVLAGYSLLWVQPLAMILGIIMLSAISYVVLSTRERPFPAINRHINPVLGWGWALASLAANVVWCLPQYSLLAGVAQQNLLPDFVGPDSAMGDFGGKLAVVAVVLVVTTIVTWAYDSGSWGVRLYEWLLKLIVGMIVVCFIGVVVQLARSSGGLPWGEVLWGFVPDLRRVFRPSPAFQQLIDLVPEASRQFWIDRIVGEQRDVLISAAATAVGVNMTFLLPYSMLARGWDRRFRGLARFDLSTGMLIPYLIATSCVVIAAASRFQPDGELAASGVVDAAAVEKLDDGAIKSIMRARLAHVLGKEQFAALSEEEIELRLEPLSPVELTLAGHMVRKDAFDLARSLQPLTGKIFANVIFGIGVVGMTLSTITLLMLNSGFVICEMLGIPPKGWPHRLGTLAAAIGALGPFVWKGAAFYLVVPTSVFGMILLPVAYWTFFLMMNQRSLLGEEMPVGRARLVWNVLMVLAAGTATLASLWSVWNKTRWGGLAAVGAFVLLVAVVQMLRRQSRPVAHSG